MTPPGTLIRFMSIFLMVSIAPALAQEETQDFTLEAIDRVWAGHDVPFALDVTDDLIAVAYYSPDRQVSVATRHREWGNWRIHRLESWTGWDSHNSLELATDAQGQLHLSGNMHNDPMVYFRTTVPGDVRSFERHFPMVAAETERQATYPRFLRDAEGRLIYSYRDGGSGNGNTLYNAYDDEAGTWARLFEGAMIDGEGERNAYAVGPVLGPDGYFHLTWVWRDTPDAATNHDLSYARSRNLRRWETASGDALTLPITLGTAKIVDPVPSRGGMINNNTLIGFDNEGRVLIAYHKFDEDGQTQVYLARHEAVGWQTYQASRWEDFRWDFGGWGSLDFRLRLEAPYADEAGNIIIPLTRDGEALKVVLDGETLEHLASGPRQMLADTLQGTIPLPGGMQMNTIADDSGIAIAWPSLPANRDMPRADIPAPSTLYLVMPTSEE